MKERVLVLNGERADSNLRRLAKALEIGQKLTGHYRYFLFGSKPCDLPFELNRVSARKAEINHLKEHHMFDLEVA